MEKTAGPLRTAHLIAGGVVRGEVVVAVVALCNKILSLSQGALNSASSSNGSRIFPVDYAGFRKLIHQPL
jgi:hypothetical protein